MRNASGDNSVEEVSVAMVPMKFNQLLWATMSLANMEEPEISMAHDIS